MVQVLSEILRAFSILSVVVDSVSDTTQTPTICTMLQLLCHPFMAVQSVDWEVPRTHETCLGLFMAGKNKKLRLDDIWYNWKTWPWRELRTLQKIHKPERSIFDRFYAVARQLLTFQICQKEERMTPEQQRVLKREHFKLQWIFDCSGEFKQTHTLHWKEYTMF